MKDKFIYPLLVIILTPSATLIGSKLKTGDWLKYFQLIPNWVIYAFIVVVILWFLLILIRKRIKYIHAVNNPLLPVVIRTPIYGYDTMTQIKYAKVNWNVLYPRDPTWTTTQPPINPHNIEIDVPPICPTDNCNTELTEKKNFFGKYVWHCVRCHFKTKSNRSFYSIDDDVKKVVKGLLISQNKNSN